MGYSIITTCPNCETSVSRTLDLLSFDHIWFKVRRKVVHRGRLVLRVLPLFPGYLFIQARNLWREVESIIGIHGFVRFGGVIEDVPDSVVCSLRERAGGDGIINEASLPYDTGAPCYVRIGGTETPGIFRNYVGPMRAIIDVPMLGRVVSVRARLGELRCMD